MALPDPLVNDLNAVTVYELHPRIIRDVFFKGTPLLAYLRDHSLVPFGGGVFSQSIFRYAPHIGGAISKDVVFDTSKKNTLSVQRFDPRFYGVNITQYLTDIRVINRGNPMVVDLVDAEMDGAMRTLNTIIAIDLLQNGQNVGGTDRTLNLNGLSEAFNDGVLPSPDGNVYTTYGYSTRNGVVGSVLNSVPRWCGDGNGNPGQITYNALLEAVIDCEFDGETPDLIVSNIAANAFMMERLQVQQRFAQETDPIWGLPVFKFRGARVIADRYFWSSTNQYGVNDPDLGNYSTNSPNATVTTAGSGITARSKFPTSTACTIGEPIGIFNTGAMELRITDDDLFGFGFTGFKQGFDHLSVAGQMLAEINLEVRDSRLGKWMMGIDS